jgi:hypothetical protein
VSSGLVAVVVYLGIGVVFAELMTATKRKLPSIGPKRFDTALYAISLFAWPVAVVIVVKAIVKAWRLQ